MTATPLQNSLLELFGLVSFIDEHTFGDLQSFREQFVNLNQDQVFETLKARLMPVCHRTLRRQVTAYVPFWRCEVMVRSKDEGEGTYPYTFQLTYVGFYKVVKQYPSDRIEQMVKTNAPALLYSAAREAIVYLTGRGRSPAILLPSITFLQPPPKVTKTVTKKAAKKALKK